MHLGLDHIDRPGSAVLAGVVHCTQHGQRGIEQTLPDRLTVQLDGIGGHQVPYIAHQQQRAPFEHQRLAALILEGPIGLQPARYRLAALVERFF